MKEKKSSILDTLTDLDSIIKKLSTGELFIIIPGPKKRKRKSRKWELLEKQPVFTLCLLAKCKDIHSCWDLREYKFLGVKRKECPRLKKIARKIGEEFQKQYFSYRLFHHGKALADFSSIDLSLIIMCLRYYLKYGKARTTQVEHLLKKLEQCHDAHLIGEYIK